MRLSRFNVETMVQRARLRRGMRVPARRELLLAVCLFAGAWSAVPARAATDASSAVAIGFTKRMVALVNEYRAARGLAALELSDDLTALALEHSRDMAHQRRLSHDRFQGRFVRAGSRSCVENVGWNYPDSHTQFQGWQDSPGHDRNLLNPRVRKVGVAVVERFATLIACE
jgi:uncharacterized protein YkwD